MKWTIAVSEGIENRNGEYSTIASCTGLNELFSYLKVVIDQLKVDIGNSRASTKHILKKKYKWHPKKKIQSGIRKCSNDTKEYKKRGENKEKKNHCNG